MVCVIIVSVFNTIIYIYIIRTFLDGGPVAFRECVVNTRIQTLVPRGVLRLVSLKM